MIKKSVCLLLIIFFMTVVISFLISLINAGKHFDIRANFSKELFVAPSLAHWGQRAITSIRAIRDGKVLERIHILDLEGIYSVEYETDYVIIMIVGDSPLSIKGLHSWGIYLLKPTVKEMTLVNTDSDLVQTNEHGSSELILLLDSRLQSLPVFQTTIISPIKISSIRHQGRFFLFDDKSAFSDAAKGPIVSFSDLSKDFTNSISINANLLPFNDLDKPIIINPLNDFKFVTFDSLGQIHSSPVYKGALMRSECHVALAQPSFDSKLEGQGRYTDIGCKVPSHITIKGEVLDYIKFSDWDGEVKIDTGLIYKEKNVDWLIKDAVTPILTIDLQPLNPNKILIKTNIKARVKSLFINSKNTQNFKLNFIKNLVSIWSNRYFAGIVIAILGGLILYWLKLKRE